MSIAHDGMESRLTFDTPDRLTKALRLSGVASNDMAEHLQMSRTTISNYINGRTIPKRSVLRDWAIRTGVPLEWLETGTIAPDPDGTPENFRKITVRLIAPAKESNVTRINFRADERTAA